MVHPRVPVAVRNPIVQIQLAGEGKLSRFTTYLLYVEASVFVAVLLFVLLAIGRTDLLFAILLVAVEAATWLGLTLARPWQIRRQVASVLLDPEGLSIRTRAGRFFRIRWAERPVFLDVVIPTSDGTTEPNPWVSWGRLPLPHTRITRESAQELLQYAREEGLDVREAFFGRGALRTLRAEIRARPDVRSSAKGPAPR